MQEGGNATCPCVSSPCLKRDVRNQAFHFRLCFCIKLFKKDCTHNAFLIRPSAALVRTLVRTCEHPIIYVWWSLDRFPASLACGSGLGTPTRWSKQWSVDLESVEPPQSEGGGGTSEVSCLSSWEFFGYWRVASLMLDFIVREGIVTLKLIAWGVWRFYSQRRNSP